MRLFFKFASWFVRLVIVPFLTAMEKEAGWQPPSQRKYDDEIKLRLKSLSEEKLRALLNDGLAETVFKQEAIIKRLSAELGGVKKILEELHRADVECGSKIGQLAKHHLMLKRQFKFQGKDIKVREEVKKPRREVDSEVLNFGDE